MMFRTHLAFGMLSAIAALHLLSPHNRILFVALCLLGSLLPDIDHPKSKVGRHIKIIGVLFEHRGFFHSAWAAGALLLVLEGFFRHDVYVLALVLGYVSHIAIDCTTKEGIMPLHPLSHFTLRGFVRTGGFVEKIVFAVLVLADIYLLVIF